MRPWADDELLYIDGVAHIYTIDSDHRKRVHFRGGGHCVLDQVFDRVTRFPAVPRIRDNPTHVMHDSSLIRASELRE